MRVLLVIATRESDTGAVRFLRYFEELRQHCESVALVRRASWLSERLRVLQLPFAEAPFRSVCGWQTRRILHRQIDTWHPDIVEYWKSGAARFAPRVAPVVNVGRPLGESSLARFSAMNYLAADSEDACTDLGLHGWTPDRIIQLPDFIARTNVEPETSRARLRESMCIPDPAYLLFATGPFEPVNGIATLLRALQCLPDRVCLMVAGDASGALRRKADRIGVAARVFQADERLDRAMLSAVADCRVIASGSDVLGSDVLDAWRYHLPVVASEAKGPRGLIDHGHTGLLTPIGDGMALAMAIQHLLREPALSSRCAEAGHRRVATEFSRESVMRRCLKFYDRAIGND